MVLKRRKYFHKYPRHEAGNITRCNIRQLADYKNRES